MALFWSLKHIDDVGPWQVGESAKILHKLQSSGIPVAESWVIATVAFEQAIERLVAREPVFADWPHLLWRTAAAQEYSTQYLAKRLRRPLMNLPLNLPFDGMSSEVKSPLLRLSPSLWFGESCATAPFASMVRSPICWADASSLEAAIKRIWCDVLSARSLTFWEHWESTVQGPFPEQVGVAIVVQAVAPLELAGTLTLRNGRFWVEAVQGLPEAIAESFPDRYSGSLTEFLPFQWEVGYQERIFQPVPAESTHPGLADCCTTATLSGTAQDLMDEETEQALWSLAKQLHQVADQPIKIAWEKPVNRDRIQVSQGYSWPLVSPLAKPQMGFHEVATALIGYPASPGHSHGLALVVHPGDTMPDAVNQHVIVTSEVSPDWLPLLKTAAAIVSEKGGLTSHAAVLARELGLPAVVGVPHATQVIKTGDVLGVDGDRGIVNFLATLPELTVAPPSSFAVAALPTAVELWLNLSQPELAARAAQLPVAGVGLLRSEWLMMPLLDRVHPYQWLKDGRGTELLEQLVAQLRPIVAAFGDRPVRYRTLDIRSNEFAQLTGAPEIESNPMIGVRGTFSYQQYPAFFQLELEALKRLQGEGYTHLHLLLPFVRTLKEVEYCQRIIAKVGLTDCPDFQVWIMAEVPSVLFLLPQYVAAGISGIAIGTHDLTQLLLGIDRDQPLFSAQFDESHPAVQVAIAQLIQQAKSLQIPCCLCGVSSTRHPDFVQTLIKQGVDAISVDLAAVEATAQLIQQVHAEKASPQGLTSP